MNHRTKEEKDAQKIARKWLIRQLEGELINIIVEAQEYDRDPQNIKRGIIDTSNLVDWNMGSLPTTIDAGLFERAAQEECNKLLAILQKKDRK
jgi:hypothetical protein